MNEQRNEQRKRGRPKKDEPTQVIAGRVPLSVYDAVQAYLEDTEPTPQIGSVLAVAVREFLEKRGYWPPPEGEDKA